MAGWTMGALGAVVCCGATLVIGGCGEDEPGEGERSCDPTVEHSCPAEFSCLAYGVEYRCFEFSKGECGNRLLDPGEQCDATEFGSHDCADFGMDPGAPYCLGDCSVHCSLCGNGVMEQVPNGASEECDDGNLEPDDGCSADCQLEE